MFSDPKISVIIPVYNAAPYLNTCISSVLTQSHQNVEVIIINDGSTDDSDSICRELAKKDDRILYRQQVNKGVSSTRNDGLDLCAGEYVLFLDSDDYLSDNFIENALEKMQSSESDLYIGGFITFHQTEKKVFQQNNPKIYTGKELFENLGVKYHSEWLGIIGSKMYKREIIENHHLRFPADINLGEDACFNFQYISLVQNIFFDSDAGYFYRIANQDSLSSKFRIDLFSIHQKVFKVKSEAMKRVGCSHEIISRYCVSTYLSDLTRLYSCGADIPKKERIRIMKQISMDDDVRTIPLKFITDTRKKIVVVLLRSKCYPLTDWLLCRLIGHGS